MNEDGETLLDRSPGNTQSFPILARLVRGTTRRGAEAGGTERAGTFQLSTMAASAQGAAVASVTPHTQFLPPSRRRSSLARAHSSRHHDRRGHRRQAKRERAVDDLNGPGLDVCVCGQWSVSDQCVDCGGGGFSSGQLDAHVA